MGNTRYPAVYTSNDLLLSFDPKRTPAPRNYDIVAQSVEEVRDIGNSPAISMGPYLAQSNQSRLLTTISIYSQRGENLDQLRLFYMNATALLIWKAMGKEPKLVGALHRPPKTALLTFGVPFSEIGILLNAESVCRPNYSSGEEL